MYDAEATVAINLVGTEAPRTTARRGRAALGAQKRFLDLAVAGALLLITLPLLLVIGLLIRLESPGPVLFRQRRGGLGGAPFVIFKFRTMTVVEDGDTIAQAKPGDCRCTGLGRFLRRTSLDELPQLLNVLVGDMSLVGPRPHALAHDAQFQSQVSHYNLRFDVKPGITGLAQIRGWRGEARTLSSLSGRLASDLEYIDCWSFYGDIKLLIATLKVPLDPRAY